MNKDNKKKLAYLSRTITSLKLLKISLSKKSKEKIIDLPEEPKGFEGRKYITIKVYKNSLE